LGPEFTGAKDGLGLHQGATENATVAITFLKKKLSAFKSAT
jgi:hypothetical protein